MALPKKLKILGHDFEVLMEKFTDNGNDNLGKCNIAMNKIWLRADAPAASQMASTLLHEIIEAINGILDIDLAHNQINLLEAGLFQTLKDNKLLNL